MATKTRAQLNSEINSLLADNTNADISAEDVRSILALMVDSDFNITDDDADDIPGINTTISANLDVSANSGARHTHSVTGAATLVSHTAHTVDDSTGGTPGTRLNSSTDTVYNDNFATVQKVIMDHDTELNDIYSQLNSVINALKSFGVLTP